MSDSSKYVLRVTAGPTYKDQKEIQVNTEKPYQIKSDLIDAEVKIRIKNFRGIPKSPETSPYFSVASRSSALYSLEFGFTLPKDTPADALLLGNDFDHPIRDRLPPLFGQAFSYAKKWIDPGLDGDPQADEPYLYGKCLSSVQTFRVGTKDGKPSQVDGDDVAVVDEGADGEEAEQIRHDKGLPATGPARQKYFLTEQHRKDFILEKGRRYGCDFYNKYLDFNDFSLKLPLGLSISVVPYWDGQPLRYVLRNQETKELLFCVSFTLVPVDEEAKKHMEEQTGKKLNTVDEHHASEDTKKGGDYEDEGVD